MGYIAAIGSDVYIQFIMDQGNESGNVDMPYPLFAYSGLIFWGLLSSGISSASESMLANSNIIKKVYFPRIIIPASAIIIALFDFLMTLYSLSDNDLLL